MRAESTPVLTRDAVRELDRLCWSEFGIPGVVLMENAGRGAAECLERELAHARERIVFLCGSGNNGGDAFVAARHLHNRGVAVELFAISAASAASSDAAWARGVIERMGLRVQTLHEAHEFARCLERVGGDVLLVDALLGTGAVGAPRAAVAECLRMAAQSKPRLRIALDLPSGLDADTGAIHEPCFRAELTLTFAARKPGLSAAICGRVEVLDIGAPRELLLRLAAT
jgi:NAD(P)H-hydrate epimerase